MTLRIAPQTYTQNDWAQILAEIERELKRRLVRGQDVEMHDGRIILTSPNGTRYALTVDNAGALGTPAI